MLKRSERSLVSIFMLVPLFNFFVAACLGLAMRYAFVWEAPWMKYRNVMHAHSYVALMGWLYMALMILLWKAFDQNISSKYFTTIFFLTELSVLGMLFAFFLKGYGVISISFLLFFVILSYLFSYKIWQQVSGRSGSDILLLKTSVIWLAASTLGLWAVIPFLAQRADELYYMAIQFFLHFQFNGWLLFAVLTLFFNQLKRLNIDYSRKYFRLFFMLLVISTVLTFALTISWSNPNFWTFGINSVGVIVQLLALVVFFRLINRKVIQQFKNHMDSFPVWIYGFALLAFITKILIQTVVIIPEVATISYTIRLYVLGFIHLITLGLVTAYVLSYNFSNRNLSYQGKLSRTGWVLLLAGIIVTEVILFGQGTLVWGGYGYYSEYHLTIFIASLLLPFGVLLAFIGQLLQTNRIKT